MGLQDLEKTLKNCRRDWTGDSLCCATKKLGPGRLEAVFGG